jgi:hypothetical protein
MLSWLYISGYDRLMVFILPLTLFIFACTNQTKTTKQAASSNKSSYQINTAQWSDFKPAENDKETFNWLKDYYVSEKDLSEYVFTYISSEADVIQTLSIRLTSENQIAFKVNVILIQSKQLSFNGIVDFKETYKINNENYFMYRTDDFLGKSAELHINEKGTSAFFHMPEKFDSSLTTTPQCDDDKAIMWRIK